MQLWTFARVDLGLASEEFYALTPRQMDALVRRHRQKAETNEFLFAQLTACVINFSELRPKEPVRVKDLMPSQMQRTQTANPVVQKRLTQKRREAIAAKVRQTLGLFWE